MIWDTYMSICLTSEVKCAGVSTDCFRLESGPFRPISATTAVATALNRDNIVCMMCPLGMSKMWSVVDSRSTIYLNYINLWDATWTSTSNDLLLWRYTRLLSHRYIHIDTRSLISCNVYMSTILYAPFWSYNVILAVSLWSFNCLTVMFDTLEKSGLFSRIAVRLRVSDVILTCVTCLTISVQECVWLRVTSDKRVSRGPWCACICSFLPRQRTVTACRCRRTVMTSVYHHSEDIDDTYPYSDAVWPHITLLVDYIFFQRLWRHPSVITHACVYKAG